MFTNRLDVESVRPRKRNDGVPLHTMVTLLCVVSGSLDAISFLALGEAFASVMTGNIVFMGVSAGTGDSRLALFCGSAIVGYASGVLVGSWLASQRRTSDSSLWPARATRVLAIQFGILFALSSVWLFLGGSPSRLGELAILTTAAAAMGLQGAAVRAIGVPVSTTYMTGALTTILEALVTRRPFSSTESSSMTGLPALAVGAAIGSLIVTTCRPLALFVPTAALLVVIAIALRHEWKITRNAKEQTHD